MDMTFAEAFNEILSGIQENYENSDHQLHKLIRTGGHTVSVSDNGDVHITCYRSGRSYGWWTLSWPGSDYVLIDHSLPHQYDPDGGFSAGRTSERWSCPVAAWCADPVLMIEDMVGKRIAREAAPLLWVPGRPPLRVV